MNNLKYPYKYKFQGEVKPNIDDGTLAELSKSKPLNVDIEILQGGEPLQISEGVIYLEGNFSAINSQESNNSGTSKNTIKAVLDYFNKQLKASILPLRSHAGRARFIVISLVYTILSASPGFSIFFIRGWRLGVAGLMTDFSKRIIAPKIVKIQDVGFYMGQGIVIVASKAVYEIPRILFMVIFGYEFVELFFDFCYWIFLFLFTEESRGFFTYGNAPENAIFLSLGISSAVKLVFISLYGLIVTPAFKIMSFRYVLNEITFKEFFNIKILKKSFVIYRKHPGSTLASYVWSQTVGLVSNFLALLFLPIFNIASLLVFPTYFLLFKHWPKAYGYGRLARKLVLVGDLTDLREKQLSLDTKILEETDEADIITQ